MNPMMSGRVWADKGRRGSNRGRARRARPRSRPPPATRRRFTITGAAPGRHACVARAGELPRCHVRKSTRCSPIACARHALLAVRRTLAASPQRVSYAKCVHPTASVSWIIALTTTSSTAQPSRCSGNDSMSELRPHERGRHGFLRPLPRIPALGADGGESAAPAGGDAAGAAAADHDGTGSAAAGAAANANAGHPLRRP